MNEGLGSDHRPPKRAPKANDPGFRRMLIHWADGLAPAPDAGRVPDELRDLYDNAPCGYHSIDAAGLIVRINATELGWLGYARDEVVGRMQITDLMAPRWRGRFAAQFALL
jgi:PAS domain-containing protein